MNRFQPLYRHMIANAFAGDYGESPKKVYGSSLYQWVIADKIHHPNAVLAYLILDEKYKPIAFLDDFSEYSSGKSRVIWGGEEISVSDWTDKGNFIFMLNNGKIIGEDKDWMSWDIAAVKSEAQIFFGKKMLIAKDSSDRKWYGLQLNGQISTVDDLEKEGVLEDES
jgi:hypothetical protein